MTPAISLWGRSLLDAEGIAPEVVAAVGLDERRPGSFVVEYTDDAGGTVPREWDVDVEPEPWPDGCEPGLWWPAGEDGSVAIICLGARDALFLTSQIFAVDSTGALSRRPGLSAALADAAPVALPWTSAWSSPEWYGAGAGELVSRILDRSPFTYAVLAVPERPIGGGPTFARFVSDFMCFGPDDGLTPALALLPSGCCWSSLLREFEGGRRRAALEGIFTHHLLRAALPINKGETR